MQEDFVNSENIRQKVNSILKNQNENDQRPDQYIRSYRATGLTLAQIFEVKLREIKDNPEEKRLADIKDLAESTDLAALLTAFREEKQPIVDFELRIKTQSLEYKEQSESKNQQEYQAAVRFWEDRLGAEISGEKIVIYLIRHFLRKKINKNTFDTHVHGVKHWLCCYDPKEGHYQLIKSDPFEPNPELQSLLEKPDPELTEDDEFRIQQMILAGDELKPIRTQSTLARIMLQPEQTILARFAAQPNNHRVLNYLFELINNQLPQGRLAKVRYSKPRKTLLLSCMSAAVSNQCLSNFIQLFQLLPDHTTVSNWDFAPKQVFEDRSAFIAEGRLNLNSALVEIKCMFDFVIEKKKNSTSYYNYNCATEAAELEKRKAVTIYFLNEYQKEFVTNSPAYQREFYGEIIDVFARSDLSYTMAERFYSQNPQLFEQADLYKILSAPHLLKYICLSQVRQPFVERCKKLTAKDTAQLSLEASWQINEIIGQSQGGFSYPIAIDFFTECMQRLTLTLTELSYPGQIYSTIIEYLVPTLLERIQLKLAELTQKGEVGKKSALDQKDDVDSGYWALFNTLKLYEELSPLSVLEYHISGASEKRNKEKFYKQFGEFREQISKHIAKPLPGLTSLDFEKILEDVASGKLRFLGFDNLQNCLSELKNHTETQLFSIIEINSTEEQTLNDPSCLLKNPDNLRRLFNAINIHGISQTINKMQVHSFFISVQGQWYVLFMATTLFNPLIVFSINSKGRLELYEDKIQRHVKRLVEAPSGIAAPVFEEIFVKSSNQINDQLKAIDEKIYQRTRLETGEIDKIYQFSRLILQCFTFFGESPKILPHLITLVQMKAILLKLEKEKELSEFSGLLKQTTTLCTKLSLLTQKRQPSQAGTPSKQCLIC
ncbi:MAG: hypothetical protein JSR33_12725 [Proteobacteria bacterium]|nr:hypothetical protein [Pseudomonadota bacterium]